MTVREIIHWPDPCLSTPARPVEHFDENLVRLVSDMIETMRAHDGIGLAAPQIGISLRLFVCCDMPHAPDESGILVFANPSVLSHAPGRVREQEGCLSVREGGGPVPRWPSIVMRGQDAAGRYFDYPATGLLAACFQHELDHLNGRLILDRMPSRQRKRLLESGVRENQ